MLEGVSSKGGRFWNGKFGILSEKGWKFGGRGCNRPGAVKIWGEILVGRLNFDRERGIMG